jgi:RimJ/RimL family protein N-acetyltransferase
MTDSQITDYISTLAHVELQQKDGNTFFFTGAGRVMPFATLVTDDGYQTPWALPRSGEYRLNLGVGKQKFDELFPGALGQDGAFVGTFNFTALDTLFPHPEYAGYGWVSVLNPSEKTFESLKPLMAEAHRLGLKHAKLAE